MLSSELTSIILAAAIALAITVPLAWKWQLGLARSTVFVVLCACSFGAVTRAVIPGIDPSKPTRVLSILVLTLLASFTILIFRFYRDPERVAPRVDGAILSPADGQVIYLHRSHRSLLPVSTKEGRQYALHELTRTSLDHEESVVIGIAMNFLDVHVNRAPIRGTVALRRDFPGRFASLRNPAMVFENRRATTVIRTGELEIAIVQIASRLVRQIVAFVSEGQAVVAGERIGAIRFGSQVDLVLPMRPDLIIRAKVGDHVVAGESIIGVCSSAGKAATDSSSPIQASARR
jgi:phosphatidylserine decarboxylase